MSAPWLSGIGMFYTVRKLYCMLFVMYDVVGILICGIDKIRVTKYILYISSPVRQI